MAKPYFTMIERDNESAPWRIEFGAFDRADVESEIQSRRDDGIRARDLRIIKTADSKNESIISAVAKLNASELLPEDRKNTVGEFVPPAFAIVNSLTGEVIDTVPAGYSPRRDVCRNTLHAVDAAKRKPRAKRTKLSAWDLALLDKLLSAEIREKTFTSGSAYLESMKDLQTRLSRATFGSLTEESRK